MLPCRYWRPRASTLLGVRLRCYGTASCSDLSLDLSRPVQSYISTSRDPYINLSIEHYLLQNSSPASAILFLYVNRPSIIIGRNQNPWLEVNLGLLNATRTGPKNTSIPQTEPPGLGDVDLVRRRSGGGTVFHDEGNVNWTVISPSSSFTRDKHAEMVVRALRTLEVPRSRVNERHDIVLDQGTSAFAGHWGPDTDTHTTPWQTDNPKSLKVSGSAYKLTRHRALHHGTALLNSPNLNIIPHYLHSPAKGFIKGRGVDSVSSPVGNILLRNEDFIEEVQREFSDLYGGQKEAEIVGEEWLKIEGVEKGWRELKSAEWTYLQTPQFTLSNQQEENGKANIHLDVKNGLMEAVNLDIKGVSSEQCDALRQRLEKHYLHDVEDWPALFQDAGLESSDAIELAKWVQDTMPVAI